MRVLHINCNYIGTTLHQKMIEYLDGMGITNKVFVPTYDKNISVIEANQNVCVCECFKKWDRIVFDYKQNKIYKGLESHITVNQYDLIHAYTLFTDGNCARKLSKKYGIPYVVAIRNTDVNDFFKLMPHLRKRGVDIMKDASIIFFLSEAYKKQVFEKYIPKKYKDEIEKKVHIIPNGIDEFWIENTPVSKKKNSKSKEIHLVYAGKINKNKNIPTIQKAVNLLNKEGFNTTLTVVGNIEDSNEFDKIQKDNNTVYFSARPKEDLINLYRKNDIFVMPSFKETFGLVYAEAMSQGLPVIYSEGQGFDGQFPEGEIGFHVKSNSPEDLCIKIKKIIFSYDELSSRAMKSAKKFSWASITEEYSEIYNVIGKADVK